MPWPGRTERASSHTSSGSRVDLSGERRDDRAALARYQAEWTARFTTSTDDDHGAGHQPAEKFDRVQQTTTRERRVVSSHRGQTRGGRFTIFLWTSRWAA